MTEKSDEQVLCEAMGWCWHTWVPAFPYDDITDYTWRGHKCSKCDEYWPTKPDGDGPVVKINFTSPDILWRVLQYMMGRGDWRGFYQFAWDQYVLSNRNWIASGGLPWLLTATYVDEDGNTKLLFVKLCADWCRDKEVKA